MSKYWQPPRSKGGFHSLFIDSPLSDEEIAAACNVSARAVNKWRNGEQTPWRGTWAFYTHALYEANAVFYNED
tara:strand:+ start:307 stop:525 length:219 start_codon:yes stop_codon:yes gene_type:complete